MKIVTGGRWGWWPVLFKFNFTTNGIFYYYQLWMEINLLLEWNEKFIKIKHKTIIVLRIICYYCHIIKKTELLSYLNAILYPYMNNTIQ